MIQNVKLSPRLERAVSMLPPCECVADIGCDHGKVSAHLLQNGICQRVVAADISAPSLEKARILAAECGLEDRISLRLGSGLGVLEPEEAQGALLLGMGGELIARILEEAPDIAGKLTLVLQPMQHGDRLRAYLRSRGYAILDEALVREGRRIHEMMKVRRAAGALPERTDGMPDEIGPLLWQRRDPLLAERLRIRVEAMERRLVQTGSGDTETAKAGDRALRERIALYRQAALEIERTEGERS